MSDITGRSRRSCRAQIKSYQEDDHDLIEEFTEGSDEEEEEEELGPEPNSNARSGHTIFFCSLFCKKS